MKGVYRLLFILHLFVGIGAVSGGLAAITNPTEPLGASVELLKNSPFKDYLIPGIILFTVIGLGNIISALMLRFMPRIQGYISSVFSWACLLYTSVPSFDEVRDLMVHTRPRDGLVLGVIKSTENMLSLIHI